MRFRFLPHMARALALVLLIAGALALATGNAAWISPSQDSKVRLGRSTVPRKLADLSITKRVKAIRRHDFIFTITVKNNSSIAAEDVIMTDLLSRRFELEYAKPKTQGVKCSGERTVKCKIGTLGAGKSATIEIRVDVEPDNFIGSIKNTATVSSKTKDPKSSNNKSSVTVRIRGRR
jgi:hypothetical protein